MPTGDHQEVSGIPQVTAKAGATAAKFFIAATIGVCTLVGGVVIAYKYNKTHKIEVADNKHYVPTRIEDAPLNLVQIAKAEEPTAKPSDTKKEDVTPAPQPDSTASSAAPRVMPAPNVDPPLPPKSVPKHAAHASSAPARDNDPNSRYNRNHHAGNIGVMAAGGEGGQPTGGTSSTTPDNDPTLASIDAQLAQLKKQEAQLNTGGGMLATGGGDARDPNLGYADQVYSKDTAIAKARPAPDLTYRILEGKIITAVLESALNSQLPGKVRAMVDYDIYSENGRKKLIPRGSRLIGEYNTDIRNGQSRVFVAWPRLIRPDGVDIRLDSSATDNLGRAGVEGTTETHFWRRFGNSVLLSLIGIGTSPEVSSTGNGLGITQQDLYRMGVLQSFSNTSSQILQQSINIKDTVLIDQGEPIKIFVAKDLDFTEALSGRQARSR